MRFHSPAAQMLRPTSFAAAILKDIVQARFTGIPNFVLQPTFKEEKSCI
jgi:hypothetical protein